MIYRCCRSILKLYAFLCYRHKTYGKEHYPAGGGFIAGNHNSFLDPPFIGLSASPAEIHYLGRDSLFRFKPFGWLLRNVNTHPVKRGRGNTNAIRKAMTLVQEGKKIVIFPEGRRSSDGELQPGQPGVGLLVQRTGCQVIPVYVHGTHEVWGRGRKLPKLCGQTACVFGTPLTFEDLVHLEKKEAQKAIVEQIMAKIAILKEWYLGGAEGTPP